MQDIDKDKIAAVVGAGPGLGASVALRFAKEGYAVALLARSTDKLRDLEQRIGAAKGRAVAVAADATVSGSISAAFAEIRQRLGDPSVLVYNAGAFQMGAVVDVTPELFESSWRANCLGGFLAAHEAVPAMVSRGKGTVIFTGATASIRGSANFSCLAVGKFGLRALAQSLAREVGPKGVHVAHVIIDGQIDTPRVRTMMPLRKTHTFLSPDSIAKVYWEIHGQDPTAWTHEIDLRPAVEKF